MRGALPYQAGQLGLAGLVCTGLPWATQDFQESTAQSSKNGFQLFLIGLKTDVNARNTFPMSATGQISDKPQTFANSLLCPITCWERSRAHLSNDLLLGTSDFMSINEIRQYRLSAISVRRLVDPTSDKCGVRKIVYFTVASL